MKPMQNPPDRLVARDALRRLACRAAAALALILCAGCFGDPWPPPLSPAVVAGRAYAENVDAFFVVDARSGALVRRVPVEGGIGRDMAKPSAVLDGVLYAGGNDLSAIDVATGSARWTIQGAGRRFQGVTVDAQRVYFQSASADDARLGVVDRATGRELWAVATPSLRAIVPAGDVVITNNQNMFVPRLVARDARTGAERWTLKEALRGPPVVAGDRLFIVVEGFALVARELDVGTGRERWRDERGDTVSLEVEGGTLYLLDGTEFRALDLATKQRRWSARCAGQLGVGSGIAVCAGAKVTARRADTGAAAWEVEAPEQARIPPVVADGIVCIRSKEDRMFALDAGTGKLLWQFDMKSGGVVSNTGGRLLVFAAHG
jgi:outer membrane protein assembly factor BamB